MQSIFVAAALAAQMSVLLPSSGNNATSYATAHRSAHRSGRALFVVLEDRSHAEGELKSLRHADSLRLAGDYQVCRIDVSTAYGAKIARSYQANKFPYSVITDDSGEIIYRGIGQLSAAKLPWTDGRVQMRDEPTRLAANLKAPQPPRENKSDLEVESDVDESDLETETVFDPTDVELAQSRARQRNRMLVAFVTTKQCHYCIKMKREALQDPLVRSKVRRDFVSARIDGDQHADWTEEHGIRMYPTVLVLTSQGQLVDRIEGYVTSDQLAARLDQASSQLISQR